MSKNIFEQINNTTEEIKTNQSDNSIDIFRKPNPVFRCNKFHRTFPLYNINGYLKRSGKRENMNNLEEKSGEKITRLNKIQNHQMYILNQNDKDNKESLSNHSTTPQTKYLESNVGKYFQLKEFSTIPYFENYLHNVNKYSNIKNQDFLLCPLISKGYLFKNNVREMIIFTQTVKDF